MTTIPELWNAPNGADYYKRPFAEPNPGPAACYHPKSPKRGQLQTVATLLKDLGAVVGEVQPEYLAQAAAPTLNISVELPADNKKALPSESAEVLEVDAAA